MTWLGAVKDHYRKVWGTDGEPCSFVAGPIHDLPEDFTVIKFAPHHERAMWTYATCSMSQSSDSVPIELHMFSPWKSFQVVELLAVIAHYYRTCTRLGLGHTVNLGRPWVVGQFERAK